MTERYMNELDGMRVHYGSGGLGLGTGKKELGIVEELSATYYEKCIPK